LLGTFVPPLGSKLGVIVPVIVPVNFDNRDLKEASRFRRCLEIVEQRVKPHRDTVNRKAHRERWWQFGDRRPGLVAACAPHERVIACAMTTVDFKFAWVPSSWVFDQTVVVIVPDCNECYGVLESSVHKTWAYEFSSGFGSGRSGRNRGKPGPKPKPNRQAALAAGRTLSTSCHCRRSPSDIERNGGAQSDYLGEDS
jgi:hypothetical protein